MVAAALDLADARGIGALTMRGLASAVGVKPMSLYHHVSGKDEVLDAMVDAVFAEIEVVDGRDWRETMRHRAHSARAALRRHPWALGLMDSRSSPGPQTLAHHDTVIGCLRRGGFSLAMTGHAVALLDAYVYGFVLQELSLPFEGGDGARDAADELVQLVSPEQYPHLVEFAAGHVMQPGYDFADEFGFGLEVVLDGLARRTANDPDDGPG